eukprot:6490741-Lingulodinium_polyedra.AAC.1
MGQRLRVRAEVGVSPRARPRLRQPAGRLRGQGAGETREVQTETCNFARDGAPEHPGHAINL